MPEIIRTVAEMQHRADSLRQAGKKIGIVPTMGALHEGHLSLVRLAASGSDVVVCTIFVNPTQFGPHEDFQRYPKSFDTDVQKAEDAGASIIFAPSVEEMYGTDHMTFVVNDVLSAVLEGEQRPGHFKGVATIVLKLFATVKPHMAVFGQKDAQQLALIRTMVRDFGLDIEIVAGPIVREPDGLAMSSRNIYLSPEERQRATVISSALRGAEEQVAGGERSLNALKSGMREQIAAAEPAAIDYIECVHPDTFQALEAFREEGTLIVVVARFGETRLLDNMLLKAGGR